MLLVGMAESGSVHDGVEGPQEAEGEENGRGDGQRGQDGDDDTVLLDLEGRS